MKRAAAFALLFSGCLTLDPFFFGNEPVESYGWDDDPCDPQLAGELAEVAHERLGEGAPGCHPSRIPPEARVEDFVSVGGVRIHYVFAHRDDALATIFYSHGTGRHIGRYWDRVELMWELGYNVMIYDYPGYGRSEGEPDEAGIYAAAEAVIDVLPQMPGVDPERVFFMGYSLGGGPTYEMGLRGVAGELAVRPRGVVSEAAFCSTEALIEDGARVNLPVEFLSDNAFDNCAKIGTIAESVPVMVMHGNADSFVVPTHARRLDASAGAGVSLLWIDDAGHTELPVIGGARYVDALQDFFSR
ncbi:MAG: alpha/beta fold hydrolase [Myxococcota bacterium]